MIITRSKPPPFRLRLNNTAKLHVIYFVCSSVRGKWFNRRVVSGGHSGWRRTANEVFTERKGVLFGSWLSARDPGGWTRRNMVALQRLW